MTSSPVDHHKTSHSNDENADHISGFKYPGSPYFQADAFRLEQSWILSLLELGVHFMAIRS